MAEATMIRLPPKLRARIHALAWGLLRGTGYIVGELPNSFAKRQLGIAPGASGHRAGVASLARAVCRDRGTDARSPSRRRVDHGAVRPQGPRRL